MSLTIASTLPSRPITIVLPRELLHVQELSILQNSQEKVGVELAVISRFLDVPASCFRHFGNEIFPEKISNQLSKVELFFL